MWATITRFWPRPSINTANFRLWAENMPPENELHCDDGDFVDWTYTTEQSPSVIEQVAAAARNGARGNRIVINQDGKAAYASLQNWASPISVGELRVVGFWWKVLVPVPPSHQTVIAVPGVGGNYAAVLWVNYNNAVKLSTYHYDEVFTETDYVPLFTGTEWHHVRLVIIRHATAGGAQLWDGNNLLIDDAKHNTINEYDGTPDWFHVGACEIVKAGFETCQDEFRIAKTLAKARPSGGYRIYTGPTLGTIDYSTVAAEVLAGNDQATIAGLGLTSGGEVYFGARAFTTAGVEETNTTRVGRAVVSGGGVLLGGPPGTITHAVAAAVAGGVVKVDLSYVAVSDATVTVQIARVVDGATDWGSVLATVSVAAAGATETTATLATPFSDGETVVLAARPITSDGITGDVFTLAAVVADDDPPPDVSRITLEAAE